ncbi:MAG: Ig-like domain-containing protein [Lachnospiraceae bacterium]|nr:Ig-like domain-containing protein [Lachnospiraceae bacterium]
MNNKRIKIIITSLILILGFHVFSAKEVSAAPNVKVKMSNKKVTIDVGKSKTIKAKVTAGKGVNKDVRWSSTNKKVAQVNSNGKITALRTGAAVIKATSKANNKVYGKCIVEVVINETDRLKHEWVVFPSINFKNKVIKNYEELQKCKEELKKKYFDKYSTPIYFSYIEEKIDSYNEEYFENKVLYLQSYIYKTGFYFIDKIERVRNADGRYILRILITDYDDHLDQQATNSAGMVFIEAPKSYLNKIDKVKFKFTG